MRIKVTIREYFLQFANKNENIREFFENSLSRMMVMSTTDGNQSEYYILDKCI